MCGYEVSINAKHVWQDKNSKRATLELMNYLSIALSAAADDAKTNGYDSLVGIYENYADELYYQCDENGLYNQVRK